MSRPKVRTVVIAVALAAGAWLVFRPSPAQVQVGAVDRGPLLVTIDEEGEARVRDRYVVVAPVPGWLERLRLDEGDPVERDQVVARLFARALDPREREAAQGRLTSAQAGLAVARARRAEVAAAAAQTSRDRERVERLAAAELVAAQELERARTDEAARAAALRSADAAIAAASGDVATARAALQSPAAGGPLALRSPADGAALRVLEEGGREVAAGAPILELGDRAAMEVVVDLLSSDAARVAPGTEVLLTGWGGDDTLRARVRSIEPAAFTKVSPLGVEEQRVNVLADLTGPPPALGDRFRVDARIVTWRGDRVLRVPASALWRGPEGWQAFVVEGGRARLRDVRIGHRGEDWAEVAGGLAEGDLVILHPGEEVRAGTRVAARR